MIVYLNYFDAVWRPFLFECICHDKKAKGLGIPTEILSAACVCQYTEERSVVMLKEWDAKNSAT